MSILVSIAYRRMVESGQAHIEHPAAFSILVSIAQKSHRNMLHMVAYTYVSMLQLLNSLLTR